MARWIAVALLVPNLCSAQTWPEGTRIFTAETATTSFPDGFSSQTQTRIVVEPPQDGLRAYSDCDIDFAFCNQRTVEGLVRTRGMDFGSAEELLDPGRTPEMTVTASGAEGDSIFPLQDGATLSWVESYQSERFSGTYDVRVSVRCCVSSLSPLATSDQLWELTMDWSRQGEAAEEGGQNVILYDEGLGWWVEYRTRTSGELSDGRFHTYVRQQILVSEDG